MLKVGGGSARGSALWLLCGMEVVECPVECFKSKHQVVAVGRGGGNYGGVDAGCC